MLSSPTLSFSEVDRRLQMFEAEHQPLAVRLDEWCIWPLLRWPVAMAMANLPFVKRSSLSKFQRVRLLLSDLSALLFLPSADYVAETYTSALLDESNGCFIDIWMDEILAALPASIKLEIVNSPQFLGRRIHARQPSYSTTTLIDTAASLLMRGQMPEEVRRASLEIAGRLQAGLPRYAPGEASIQSSLGVFYWKTRIWKRLLSRIRPKCVLVADPGDYALMAAAKEHGIPVIEFQHGLIDRYNPAYSWTHKMLPYRPHLPVPDYLFVHGEYWKRELQANGFWGDEVKVVGNARVDRYRRRRENPQSRARRRIVFASQGIAVEEAAAFLRKTWQSLPAGTRSELIIKLHPVYEQDRTSYCDAFEGLPEVSVVAGNEQPSTFELLAIADAHISISSTTHYDALALGVPTFVLPLSSYETVQPLVDCGHARLIQSPEELAQTLTASLPPVEPAISAYYAVTDAVGNSCREIAAVMGHSDARTQEARSC